MWEQSKQDLFIFLKERKKCVPYFQLILNLAPLIFREAGCCGYRHFLPKSSALRVQFLQVTLTELDQVRINALFAGPLTKQKRKIKNSFFCNIFHSHLPACILLWHALLSLCNWWQVLSNLFAIQHIHLTISVENEWNLTWWWVYNLHKEKPHQHYKGTGLTVCFILSM